MEVYREHSAEFDVEALPEDGHGEARFHDGLAHAVVDSLHLRLSQRPQEHLRPHQGR